MTQRSERIAAIDVGSNSIKLLVADVPLGRGFDSAGPLLEVERWGRVTRLSRGLLAGGPVDADALHASRAALGECVERARTLGAGRILAAATGGLRLATDPDRTARQLGADIIPVAILDARMEALISLLGLRAGAGWPAELLAIDLGGASTEVTRLHHGEITSRSLPVGAVTMTEAYLLADPPTAAQLARLDRHLDVLIDQLPLSLVDPPAPERTVIGVGGTITALALVLLGLPPASASTVHGVCLEESRLARVSEDLAAISSAERQARLGISPGRADILVGGGRILRRLLDRLPGETLRVSGWGLRHGLAIAAGLLPDLQTSKNLDERQFQYIAQRSLADPG